MLSNPRLTFRHSIALDVGTAWTRAANPKGGRFSIESQHSEAPALTIHAKTSSKIIGGLLKALRPHYFWRPGVVAAISTCASVQERDLFTDTLYRSGAGRVTLVPQAFAAAVGAGLDPSNDHAQMMIDIGEGFTELALVRSGKVTQSHSMQFGCGTLKKVIAEHFPAASRRKPGPENVLHWLGHHSLGEATRRRLIGEEPAAELRRQMATVADESLRFFRSLPDQHACEVIENGITLIGGGAMILDLRSQIAMRTGITIHVPANPLTSLIEGVAKVMPYALMNA
ncbi:MAG TPA: rod shape-determining protein [Chthoniobacteraceae bacterium]|nr:rod shape-determining protein [Chthoniobacteraceae bacterium]